MFHMRVFETMPITSSDINALNDNLLAKVKRSTRATSKNHSHPHISSQVTPRAHDV
jgi:hypothetical protein